jgi:hypothetical protein
MSFSSTKPLYVVRIIAPVSCFSLFRPESGRAAQQKARPSDYTMRQYFNASMLSLRGLEPVAVAEYERRTEAILHKAQRRETSLHPSIGRTAYNARNSEQASEPLHPHKENFYAA